MGNMGIGHNQAIVADNGFAFRGCSAIDGHAFAENGVVSDFGSCNFSFKFQVLRDTGNNGSGKYLAIIADPAPSKIVACE